MRKDIMKRLSLAFLVVLVSALALTSASTTALAAPAIHEDFDATMVDTGFSWDDARSWTDEEGVQHVRGFAETLSITGDIEGVVELTVNWNFVDWPSYPSGDAQAKGTITSDEGVYLISADMTAITGTVSGTFVIHGTGNCKGIHITGTFSRSAAGLVLEGTKLTTKP